MLMNTVTGLAASVQEKVENSQAGTAKGARKLVKCLVCGEIFGFLPGYLSCVRRRPGVFCGGGRRGYGLCRDTEDFFVIIGNGIAGLSAAEEIRKEIRPPRLS